jgi:hypothetical protein
MIDHRCPASTAVRTESALLQFPVDAQTSILSILPRGDLVRFARVNRGSSGVAFMDRLWRPLLVRHFRDVVPSVSQDMLSSSQRFLALAGRTPCSVCFLRLLHTEAGTKSTRYPYPHSCIFCGSLCCVACHCMCRCLDTECHLTTRPIISCRRCKGVGHDHHGCVVINYLLRQRCDPRILFSVQRLFDCVRSLP